MNFYLPIAEISINIYVLLSLGVGIGFISGLFGIGGGFISSPLLILVGVPPAVAVGSTTVQVFASTSTGVINHYQKKNIDYQMGITMILGGVFGTLTGVLLLNNLQNIGAIDNYLSSIYVVLLLGTAIFILYETAKVNIFYKNKKFKLHQHSWIHGLPFKFKYRKSKLYISILAILSLNVSNAQKFDEDGFLKDYSGDMIITTQVRGERNKAILRGTEANKNREFVLQNYTGIQPSIYPAWDGGFWPKKKPKSLDEFEIQTEFLDELVNWGVDNGFHIMHHCLIFPNKYFPQWFSKTNYSAEELDFI